MRWRWQAATVLLVAGTLTVLVSCARPGNQPRQTLDSAIASRVTSALKIAQRKWGVVCQGRVTVRRGDLPAGMLARASYRFAEGDAGTAAGFYDCTITIKHGSIADARFAAAVCHEVGHLAGYRAPAGREFIRPDGSHDIYHSANKRSLMYPTLTPSPWWYAPCTARHHHRPATLRAAGDQRGGIHGLMGPGRS